MPFVTKVTWSSRRWSTSTQIHWMSGWTGSMLDSTSYDSTENWSNASDCCHGLATHEQWFPYSSHGSNRNSCAIPIVHTAMDVGRISFVLLMFGGPGIKFFTNGLPRIGVDPMRILIWYWPALRTVKHTLTWCASSADDPPISTAAAIELRPCMMLISIRSASLTGYGFPVQRWEN